MSEEIDRAGPVPPYIQLAAIVRGMIERGEIPPGRPVPSKRALTQRHGVSRGTVDKAMKVLKDEGLIYEAKGLGLFTREP